jgi:hypothetical protein
MTSSMESVLEVMKRLVNPTLNGAVEPPLMEVSLYTFLSLKEATIRKDKIITKNKKICDGT